MKCKQKIDGLLQLIRHIDYKVFSPNYYSVLNARPATCFSIIANISIWLSNELNTSEQDRTTDRRHHHNILWSNSILYLIYLLRWREECTVAVHYSFNIFLFSSVWIYHLFLFCIYYACVCFCICVYVGVIIAFLRVWSSERILFGVCFIGENKFQLELFTVIHPKIHKIYYAKQTFCLI